MVERRRIIEHIVHFGDFKGIPVADVLIECRRTPEHIAHVSDVGGIPSAYEYDNEYYELNDIEDMIDECGKDE